MFSKIKQFLIKKLLIIFLLFKEIFNKTLIILTVLKNIFFKALYLITYIFFFCLGLYTIFVCLGLLIQGLSSLVYSLIISVFLSWKAGIVGLGPTYSEFHDMSEGMLDFYDFIRIYDESSILKPTFFSSENYVKYVVNNCPKNIYNNCPEDPEWTDWINSIIDDLRLNPYCAHYNDYMCYLAFLLNVYNFNVRLGSDGCWYISCVSMVRVLQSIFS